MITKVLLIINLPVTYGNAYQIKNSWTIQFLLQMMLLVVKIQLTGNEETLWVHQEDRST